MTERNYVRIQKEGLQKSAKRYPALKRADTYNLVVSNMSLLYPQSILTDRGPGTYQMSSKSRPERRDHVQHGVLQHRKENK